MNVFEDQHFLLRRPPTPDHPLGERVRRSYREIMTGGDEDLRFDYPLEYYNVAALGLCAALTQAVFEPADTFELVERLHTPLSDEEFERAVASLRDVFSIDGNVRFMQGPEPVRDKKGRYEKIASLADKLLVTASDFMNRAIKEWVLSTDQIPLLLFARATFFEKSAGRGYLTGTSGDLEVRTFLIDRTSLRKTIWLNVLSREQQQRMAGDYTPAGSSQGYDQWMWQTPPTEDVSQGHLSLRSGLFWMVANNFIEIGEVAEQSPCIVTGEEKMGRVGTGVVTHSTGVGYGVKVSREKGPDVRQSFFRHPNAPYQVGETKDGTPYVRHLSLDDAAGLFGHMGGLFYSSPSGSSSGYRVAPVLEQLYAIRDEMMAEEELRVDLHCFGFYMLSSKQNIHGGCESELFHYPILGSGQEGNTDILHVAHGIMVGCANHAELIRSLLSRAVQLCMMVQIDSKENEGRLTFKPKTNLDAGGFVRDIGREYWSHVGGEIQELLRRIGAHGSDRDALTEATEEIESWWKQSAARHARLIFDRVFSDHCTSPQHLIAAHNARSLFYGSLRKNMGITFSGAPTQKASTVETTQE